MHNFLFMHFSDWWN